MSKNSFVCFVTKEQPTINEPSDSLIDLKTSEILSKMQNESKYLYIHTPLYVKPLQMDSYPLKDFNDLVVSKKFIKFEKPDYYLSFEPTINFIDILVTPKVKQSFEIPPYYVRFELEALSKMTAGEVRDTIQQQFGFEVNSSKIYFMNLDENEYKIKSNEENLNRTESVDSIDILVEKEQIPDDGSAQSIIDTAQSKNLYVFFDLTEGTISKIKKRINIIAEIISTEKTYINDLRVINENWQPGLQKFISSDDSQLVFKDIAVIKTCHQSFLSDLEAEGSKYGSKVASTFIDFSNFFKVSQQYISNYNEISEILKKYEKNKKMKEKMAEIANSLDGRDLYSYLITPVQRMPRYLLFLRDLLKVTVQSHPDAELLPTALQSIDEVTKRIDKSTETSKNQQKLMKLQKMITNFTFLDKQRNLILNTKVSIINGNTVKKGEILIFDDLIVVIKTGKTCKAIFDSPIQRFHFQSQRPDNLSITIDSTSKKYLNPGSYTLRKSKQKGNELLFQIKFSNNEEMQKFFEEIEKLQEMEMFKFEKMSNRYIFKWNSTTLQRHLPYLSSPFISGFEGSLLIISSNEDNPNSSSPSTPEIYRIALSNGTIFKVDVKFPALKLPMSMATYKKCLYFINDDKLYKYDPKKNKLTTIQASFTPRVGHSSVFCGDNLMIFGGRSTLTNQPLNDLIVYNTKRDMLMVVNPNESAPQPRWRHCSFSHKDKLYIFGGETADGSIKNDLYSYELESATWTKIQTTGDKFIPRKDGKAVISDHYIILIGGENAKNKIDEATETEDDTNKPQIFNLKKKTVQTVENFGNVPNSLTCFDAVFSPNNGFSLCIITPNNLYNISTPAILQKSSSSKHFDESEETKRRASQENLPFFPFTSSSSKKNHKRSKSPHGFSKKGMKSDINSLSFEQFKLDKDTELDIHEKPLNDQELLLQDSEGSRFSTNVSDEDNENEIDDLAKFKHSHRKRGKTHMPNIPRPKTSPQSSMERFIEVTTQYDEESSSEIRNKASLSICNAFPESLQKELTSEKEEENDTKEIKKQMNLSFCYENQEEETDQKENKINSPKKIEKVMNLSLINENKDNDTQTENVTSDKENKTIQVENIMIPNKIEKVTNFSVLNENKNIDIVKERSIDLYEKSPDIVEKEMTISFSYENKDYSNQEIEEEEEDKGSYENKTIQVESSSSPKKIEKVMNISLFYENQNQNDDTTDSNTTNTSDKNDNDNNVIEPEKQNIGEFAYSKRNIEDLSLNENLVFEVEEEDVQESTKLPVVAIAATAAISVLLTAGAFFVFKRMRK